MVGPSDQIEDVIHQKGGMLLSSDQLTLVVVQFLNREITQTDKNYRPKCNLLLPKKLACSAVDYQAVPLNTGRHLVPLDQLGLDHVDVRVVGLVDGQVVSDLEAVPSNLYEMVLPDDQETLCSSLQRVSPVQRAL